MPDRIKKGILAAGSVVAAYICIISPMILLLFVVGVIAAMDRMGTHRSFVRNLDTHGYVVSAEVDFQNRENDWIFVRFDADNRTEKSIPMDMEYYPPETWNRLRPGAKVEIMALPITARGSDRAILAGELDTVRSYRPYLKPDIVGILGISWALLVFKPQIFYLGLVDGDQLMEDGLRMP